MNPKRRLIIVSGISGAGKTVVLNTLEDLSFYTIDNLPVSLLNTLIEQFSEENNTLAKHIAIGIDARNTLEDFSFLPETIKKLEDKNIPSELIFIEANDDVLTRRFSETRRKHPLSSEIVSLTDAIQQERNIIGPLAEASDLRIDTSYMQLHELRNIVRQRIDQRKNTKLSLQFMSFGFKNGLPKDADFIFDLRCLPNPYWNKDLRKYSGKEQPVIEFLSKQNDVIEMMNDLEQFLNRWIPSFEADNRSYLSIAFGCTGGHHRSVFFVEQLANKFNNLEKKVMIRHRDL
jgi:UPF0042 nucleotide-binding protein